MMRYYILFCWVPFLICSCSSSPDDAKKSVFLSRFDTEILLSPDQGDSLLIGRIVAMTVDSQSNLYVLDSDLQRVTKISNNGDDIDFYEFGEGRGPGEFLSPSDIAVDSLGNLYILGRSNAKIAIINQHKELINEVILEYMPAQMVVDENQNIYTLAFPFSYSGPIIKKYARDEYNDYHRVKRFGKRPEVAKSRVVKMTGNTDNMTLDSRGNIYLSFFFPYEIRKYSAGGNFQSTMTRANPPFTKPELSGGLVTFDGGNWEIFTLKENIVISQVLEVTPEDKWNLSFDIFKDGIYRETLADSVLSIPARARYVVSNKHNTIYAGSNSPKPQIVKLTFK